MPLEIRHTRRARRDVAEIWRYIAERDEVAASGVVGRISEVVATLGHHPLIGRERNELGRELRSIGSGRYIVFYEVRANYVNVVRVLAGERNITVGFFGENEA